MNWQEFWNKQGSLGHASKQVGRVVQGEMMTEDFMKKIAARICLQLSLKPEESLLDVCCGNALLDKYLAPSCNTITGIDFSEALIQAARNQQIPHAHFYCADAGSFKLEQHFDKLLLYFSFQYFETDEAAYAVIKNLLRHMKPGSRLLIGDITDKRKWFKYYNSMRKWMDYLWQSWQGKNNMGRFWSPQALIKLVYKAAEELQIDGQKIECSIHEQEAWQPYAHYRFDLLLKLNA